MPLYSLGSNSSYQLSLPHTKDVSSPSLTTLSLPFAEYPVKIVAGANHTLLLTNQGSLYATGANKYGQCLVPACDAVQGLKKVEGKWKDCAATWEGSVAVKEDGTVWSFGKIRNHENFNGLVLNDSLLDGVNHEETNDDCRNGKIRVFGGVQHFIVLKSGYALGYGDGKKGQLGPSTNGNGTKLPIQNISQVACGKEFTCLLTNSNQLKVYTTNDKHNLTSIPPIQGIKQIAASWSTIAVLDNAGKVTAWGRSDRGQFPPTNLPPLSHLASGSEHFLGLSQDKVYAWGWNEHGNCGADHRHDITTLHTIPLPRDEVPRYIAAGCGTSWIWTEKC